MKPSLTPRPWVPGKETGSLRLDLRLESQLDHLFAEQPCANHPTSLSLDFFIYEIEVLKNAFVLQLL